MSAPALILVNGHDPELLKTRRWVLEKAGFQVLVTTSRVEAEQLSLVQPIDLFLVCHSLPTDEAKRILLAARSLHPQMKSLVLTADAPAFDDETDRVLSAFVDARTLIEATHNALAGRTVSLLVDQ